jgi:tRNA 2-thiouridine synthesizing protein A
LTPARENLLNNDPNSELPRISLEQMMESAVAAVVDASGLRCPLPLLRAKQALRDLASGDVLRVSATDGGSVRDFNSFAAISGHALEGFCEKDGTYIYLLRKK